MWVCQKPHHLICNFPLAGKCISSGSSLLPRPISLFILRFSHALYKAIPESINLALCSSPATPLFVSLPQPAHIWSLESINSVLIKSGHSGSFYCSKSVLHMRATSQSQSPAFFPISQASKGHQCTSIPALRNTSQVFKK